ncbi:Sphingosine 1-phosphate receptor 3-like protein [Daphnia magna]|uniref:Sphingosine 1-phosphate receptor 3-like protein n=1 Tax=Daphnia magna TaxID=35525 RepID=A0A164QQR0_9CRUS|nr:Sphingosine 1-phosphate receptor 3-like protein [Daphnia magna]
MSPHKAGLVEYEGENVTLRENVKSTSFKLSEDIGYVLYSALGSFYIPSCIMVFVYIRIYYAARARARRSQENKIKRKLSQTKEQQLEQQHNHRRVSKQQKEIQQHEQLEMKPIKVTVTDSKHPHVQQQSIIANNGNAVAHGDSGRPHLPTVTDCYSRGSLTNIKTFVLSNCNAIDARRHSLSTGGSDLRVMTTNWGPSLSVDRLSVVDGRTNKRNVKEGFASPSNRHKEKILHSTAPSSLTAINESSSTTNDGGQQAGRIATRGSTASPSAHQPVAHRPSSLKNGGDRTSLTTRHCVTFECVSADNSVSYSRVRCSVTNGDQHNERLANEKTVDVETESTTATESTSPAINRRTPLLCPKSRSKFEKLARRILASGMTEGGRMPNPDATIENNRMNTSATYEWSSATNEDDHHLESPSPITASDVPIPLPQALIPCDTGITARDANNHKNLRSGSSLQQDNEHEMASDGGLDPSSSDSGTLARCTVVRPLKIRFCRPNSGSVHKKSSKAKRQCMYNHRPLCYVSFHVAINPVMYDDTFPYKKPLDDGVKDVIDTGRVVVREKDPARERRRISRQREKRATLILGLIMGAFIACWLPFFFLYLLAPVCPSCNIQPWGFAFAFWLGYINSALNPVIYTIFNKDFRRAFRRILFRCTIAPY